VAVVKRRRVMPTMEGGVVRNVREHGEVQVEL
jgi:hypothetical protein